MVKVKGATGIEKARIWTNATWWNAKAHAINALAKAGILNDQDPMPIVITEVHVR